METTQHLSLAHTILDQIKNCGEFLPLGQLGFKNAAALREGKDPRIANEYILGGIIFKAPGLHVKKNGKKATHVAVYLMPDDTYTVQLARLNTKARVLEECWVVIEEGKGVYCDELGRWILSRGGIIS